MSRVFEANFYGSCAACGDDIDPGQQVRYSDDDELVHADCTPTPEPRPAEVCRKCFVTRPCFCEADQ